jgi:hypothetical protein
MTPSRWQEISAVHNAAAARVLKENTGALGFYRANGFAVDLGIEKAVELGAAVLIEVGYARNSSANLRLHPTPPRRSSQINASCNETENHIGHHAACSRAVSVARDERVRRRGAVTAHGAYRTKCSKHSRRSQVHALRRGYRALLGPPGPGRESLGVAVHVRAAPRLAACRNADDAIRQCGTVHRVRTPVSWPRLGKHRANVGRRLQRAVRAPVRDDGDNRGRRDIGPDYLFYNGSCRAQRVHRSIATKFASSIGHRFRKHLTRPAAGRKRLGRMGSVWIGRPHGGDEN